MQNNLERAGPSGPSEMFLELVLNYYDSELLRGITIRNIGNNQNIIIDPGLLLRTAPYFKNLVSLRLHLTSFECSIAIEQRI